MNVNLEKLLLSWKRPYLSDQDLMTIFPGDSVRRYDTVKYALKRGILIHIRRGLYFISPPYSRSLVEPFELAQLMYGPSYISLESALSYHGWIPEAVYATTSASAKRGKTFQTPFGLFRYYHIPMTNFFLDVQRITASENIFLIAEPWKAIADYIYVHHKAWKSIQDVFLDLRVELETMQTSDLNTLEHVCKFYHSQRVHKILQHFYLELK